MTSIISRPVFKALLLSSSIALLAACGGGGGSSTAAAGPVQNGKLLDSAVIGVQYTTSGGLSGITGSNGQFQYRSGDTVTFKIGSLVLGSMVVTGSDAIVTPILLATTGGVVNSNKVVNLLVLLQSLDEDGLAGNGLSINPAVGAALTAGGMVPALDGPSGAAFSATLTDVLDAAGDAGGPGVAIDPTVARNHFAEQMREQLTGTWYNTTAGNDTVIRFNSDGEYVLGTTGVGATADDGAGIERGITSINPATGVITVPESAVDTNADWGLSGNSATLTLVVTGENTFVIKEAGQPDAVFTRVVDTAAGFDALALRGTWTNSWGDGLSESQLIFTGTGKYFLLSPTAGGGCETAGVESGSYTVTTAVPAMVVTISGVSANTDTNGCAGFYDMGVHTSLTNVRADTTGQLSFTADGDNFVLYRTGVDPRL